MNTTAEIKAKWGEVEVRRALARIEQLERERDEAVALLREVQEGSPHFAAITAFLEPSKEAAHEHNG